jgi:tellurite resistance protein TerC
VNGSFDAPLWLWAATIGLVLALIAFELVQATVRPHRIGLASAAIQSVVYVLLALAFGLVVLGVGGADSAGEYVAGWLIEKSLSVDNLFVFVIVMTTFAVPARLQPKVLIAGIAGALLLRGVFIAVGAAALDAFSFTYVVFGAFLLYTAAGLVRHRHQTPEVGDGRVVRAVRRLLPVTDDYHGTRMTAVVGGLRHATPLLLVTAAILSADVLFALDSIPAVFGVTGSPFIVFAANAFALLGLRALFFLVAGLLDRLVYLSIGLAIVLAFVGVKLILQWGHTLTDAVPHVPVAVSLAFIVATLAITTLASLWRSAPVLGSADRPATALRRRRGAGPGVPGRGGPAS